MVGPRIWPPDIKSILLLVILATLMFDSSSSAVDTSELTQSTLSDGRNSADQNSVIKYRKIEEPPTKTVKCTKCVGSGGMRSFLDSANGFAHLVSPDVHYDYIKKIKDSKTDELTSDYEKLVKENIGLVICVAIGVLFMVFFPIVGCCFCFCRCCGNCVGNRKEGGLAKKRPCLLISMTLLTIFVGVGGVLMITSSNSFSDGLTGISKDVPSNLDNLVDFFNNTAEVVREIATKDLYFTRNVIFRDLDSIGYILGGAIRDTFKKKTKDTMNDLGNSVGKIDTALTNLKQLLPEVNDQIEYVKSNVTAYMTAMTIVKVNFDKGMNAIGGGQTASNIESSIDPGQLNTLNGTSQLANVGNLTEKLESSTKEIDDIPERVHNNSEKSVSDLKTSILDYTSSVESNTDDLDFADNIDTKHLKDEVNYYTDMAKKYDKYRSYAGNGLAGIVLLITLLFLCGIVFGSFGSSGSHQRRCASNSGGNCLIAAIVLTFIFGSILMLCTTLLFAAGTPLENYVCVKDTAAMDKLIDIFLGSVDDGGTYLGEKILDDPTKNLTVSEIIFACKNNKPFYKAFRLNESDLLNITEILDYKSKFSVKDDLSNVKVDFDTIKVLTPTLKKNLKDLNDTIQYDFKRYTDELDRDPTENATKFKADLQSKMQLATNVAFKGVYKETIKEIDDVLIKEGKSLNDSMAVLKGQVNDLTLTLNPPSQPSLSEEIGLIQTAMSDLDDNIGSVGNTSFNYGLESFTDRIFGIVDSYIDHLLHALDYDIGKCKPVWNTYNSLLIENLCGTLIASFNGFWFALGWSLFFLMPSIIFGTKLANHFRTMKLYSGSEGSFISGDEEFEMDTIPDSKGPPMFHRNKVAPESTIYPYLEK